MGGTLSPTFKFFFLKKLSEFFIAVKKGHDLIFLQWFAINGNSKCQIANDKFYFEILGHVKEKKYRYIKD